MLKRGSGLWNTTLCSDIHTEMVEKAIRLLVISSRKRMKRLIKEFKLVKGAASADDEISAISGSTITSTADTNAVNAALYFNSILE